VDPRRCIHLLVAALLLAAALPGQAGVYKWVDESGKITYTDTPPPNAAGKSGAVAVEEKISVMGMDPAIRAAAERRFAAEAEAEERDWQRRQQAMVLQQQAAAQAQAAAAVSTADNYYPYYYAPYYRAAYYPASYVRGPYYGYGRVINKVPPRVTHYSPRSTSHARPGFAPRAGSAPRPGGRPR
jgi:hypothetical protein